MTSDAASDLPLVTHWIGGKPDATELAERFGDVYDPATGKVHEEGRLRLARRRRRGGGAAASRPSRPGATPRSRSAPSSSSPSASSRPNAPASWPEIVTSEHGKVLDDALGEVNRGLEVIEFACGIPQLLEGQLLRERLDERGRVLDPPAARARSRSSARSTSPPWCRPGSSRSPSPAATPSC